MLSIRQQTYKKFRLKGFNQTRAALAAGYSFKYATHRSKVLETVVDMKSAFARKGIDDDALVDFALEGLSATKRYGKDGDVEDKDWATIHKFFESICKLTGRLNDKAIDIDMSQHEHFTITVKHPEIKNADQGNSEGLRVNGETGESPRLLNLS